MYKLPSCMLKSKLPLPRPSRNITLKQNKVSLVHPQSLTALGAPPEWPALNVHVYMYTCTCMKHSDGLQYLQHSNTHSDTDGLQELFNCHIHIEPNEGLVTSWSLAVSSHAILLCEGFLCSGTCSPIAIIVRTEFSVCPQESQMPAFVEGGSPSPLVSQKPISLRRIR